MVQARLTEEASSLRRAGKAFLRAIVGTPTAMDTPFERISQQGSGNAARDDAGKCAADSACRCRWSFSLDSTPTASAAGLVLFSLWKRRSIAIIQRQRHIPKKMATIALVEMGEIGAVLVGGASNCKPADWARASACACMKSTARIAVLVHVVLPARFFLPRPLASRQLPPPAAGQVRGYSDCSTR